jgi:hypothetical protein
LVYQLNELTEEEIKNEEGNKIAPSGQNHNRKPNKQQTNSPVGAK